MAISPPPEPRTQVRCGGSWSAGHLVGVEITRSKTLCRASLQNSVVGFRVFRRGFEPKGE